MGKPVLWLPSPIHPKSLLLAHSLFTVIDREHALASQWFEHADAAVVRTGGIRADEASRASKLRIVCRNGTGYESIPLAACRDKGIVCTNLPGFNASAVAELALGLALSVVRRISETHRKLREGKQVLRSIDCIGTTLEGRTLGLVGMGDIAYWTARKFVGACDCKVLVYSPTSAPSKWTSKDDGGRQIPHQRIDSLKELLEQSDIVSLHCPLTQTTRHLMSTEQFASMKPSSILLNTARGSLVDTKALLSALQSGQIAGAGLDTLEIEPVTRDNYGALLDLDNVVVTPHTGAGTQEVQRGSCDAAVRTAHHFLTTGELGEYGSKIIPVPT